MICSNSHHCPSVLPNPTFAPRLRKHCWDIFHLEKDISSIDLFAVIVNFSALSNQSFNSSWWISFYHVYYFIILITIQGGVFSFPSGNIWPRDPSDFKLWQGILSGAICWSNIFIIIIIIINIIAQQISSSFSHNKIFYQRGV